MSTASTGVPIANLVVGIGVDRAALDRVSADVKRKMDETGKEGDKNPLLNQLLYGRGGPESLQKVAEHTVLHGIFGRLGRAAAMAGFGGLGIALGLHELIHLFSGGGEAANEFAEKVERGRDALREMATAGMKASDAVEKADAKWRDLLAGKDVATTMDKLQRSGLSPQVMAGVADRLKEREQEEAEARKAINPIYDPGEKGKVARAEMEATNLNKINESPGQYDRVDQEQRERNLENAARKALASQITQETIASQRDIIGRAQREHDLIDANARKAAELVPKTSAAAAMDSGRGRHAQLSSMEDFAKKIIEIGAGNEPDDRVPREQLDVLKSIDNQWKVMGGKRGSVVK